MVQQKTLRVKFTKVGKLQYISHLDLLRTMQTALRRAKVKMMYSEGFNPHMKITFALPLSIGIESVCEYMDIKTDESVTPEYVKENLSKNLPTDMKVIDVYEPQSKLTDIKYAEYEVYLDYGKESEDAAMFASGIFSGELVVTKRTKKGEKEVDISPMIKSVISSYADGITILKMKLCADSENYLNPFYLTSALDKEVGSEAFSRRVVRTNTYFEDGTIFA